MADVESRKTVIPARRSRSQPSAYTTEAPALADIAEDDSYYDTRPQSSARRYQPPRAKGGPMVVQGPARPRMDAYGRPVVSQGNRDYVMVSKRPVRRFHWSVFLGLIMLLMIAGWLLLSALGTWWTNWRDYTDYGYPRTYQVDAVVGHHDSLSHPSHFIFMNLDGTVVIVEFPGGDIAKAVDYRGPTLLGSDPSYVPVTGRFALENGSALPDMIVSYGGNSQTWTNNGARFIPPAGS